MTVKATIKWKPVERKPLISVMIPAVPSRMAKLSNLVTYLRTLAEDHPEEIEIIALLDDWGMTTGRKDGELLRMALGKYVVWIHDDDSVTADYFKILVPLAAGHNVDVIGYPMRRFKVKGYEDLLTAGPAATAPPFQLKGRFPGAYCLWRREYVSQFLDVWPDQTPSDVAIYELWRSKSPTSIVLDKPEYLYYDLGESEARRHYTI